MKKMITKLTEKINFDVFAAATKSESKRPYLITETGEKILLYKLNDNPFENKGFTEFEGKNVTVAGEFKDNAFIVIEVIVNSEDSAKEEGSK